MHKIFWILALTLFSACSGMKYNYEHDVTFVSFPTKDVVAFATVGDRMVIQAYYIETQRLVLNKTASGACFTIPDGSYLISGEDDAKLYFYPGAVKTSAFCDEAEGLYVYKTNPAELCVVTVVSGATCYKADYYIEDYEAVVKGKRNQSLLYSGYDGTKVFFTYLEEYEGEVVFTHDVQYDLAEVKSISYRGAVIDIYDFNNGQISYRLVETFRDAGINKPIRPKADVSEPAQVIPNNAM